MSTSAAKIAFSWILRKADLSPPLGYPGGSCHLIDRIQDNVKNPGKKEDLIQKVEVGDKINNQEANLIYDYELDRGARNTRFQAVVMTPHAQYRMDQRGITVGDLLNVLMKFHKQWAKEKSRDSSRYQDWEDKIRKGREIEYAAAGITVIFEVATIRGKLAANVITAWEDGNNPRPQDREDCDEWEGWSKDEERPSRLESLFGKVAKRWVDPSLREAPRPGIQTYVSEKSKKDLPNDSDREKQVVLPLPGSATPGGAGRDIGKFEYNTPGPNSDIKPRTLSEPGEERGHPTNWSVDTFKRRTMTSGEEEELEEEISKTAYKQRWKPGRRQRRSKGQTRQKRRQYNRRNKAKRKQYAKRWRRKNKNSGAYKASQKRRKTQNRTRRRASEWLLADPARVAEMYREMEADIVEPDVDPQVEEEEAAEFAAPNERGGEDGRVQRRQKPQQRLVDRRRYKANPQYKMKNRLYYHRKCKINPKCMKRRERTKEKPNFYGRKAPRIASVLTIPEIAFAIGPDLTLGYVDSISSMSGMVTFRLQGSGVPPLDSMALPTFLRLAVFFTDDDIDAFFNLVDVEVGEEAYEDLDQEGLRDCAMMYGKDLDSAEFKGMCKDLVGEDEYSSMTPSQIEDVNDTLVTGLLEGGGIPRSREDAEDGDEDISEMYDPHLFYGEVDNAEDR